MRTMMPTQIFKTQFMPLSLSLLGLAALFFAGVVSAKESTILNVSYDVSRELYKDVNLAFADQWLKQTGDRVTIQQSHDGSSKQAAAVIAGLEADVVTMNQEPDIDKIAAKGLISKDWRTRFPNNSAPYTSTMVFLVRKGNPKNIKDWDDLIKADNVVILSNPKTSGNARYSYLAAWGYALRKSGSEEKAREFITQLFRHAPILNTGGRAATNSFIQNNIGDVLLTFENEAFLIAKDLGADKFDVVVPSISIEADHPVAIIEPVVDKKGTRKVAEAYLGFLWTDAGQEIIAKHHYRPRNPEILARHADQFTRLELFSITDIIPGGWAAAQRIHFADGGLFDQIYDK
jgi:sulfate transport system substrate-binding protein